MGEVASRVGRGQTLLNVNSLRVGTQALFLMRQTNDVDPKMTQETPHSLISSSSNLISYLMLNSDPAVLLVEDQGFLGKWTKKEHLNSRLKEII